MRTIVDMLYGIAFSLVVAFAGRTLFGEIPGVALWRVLFFGLGCGYVHGYFVATRPKSYGHDALVPRRHRSEREDAGGRPTSC